MRIKRTVYDIVVNVLCIGMLLGVIIYLFINWSNIPDNLAGHYNAAGNIDRWGSKGEILITPIIAWIMYIGLTIIERFPQIWNTGIKVTESNKEKVYRILKNLLGTLKVYLVFIFLFITVYQSILLPLPTWFLPVSLILVFGTLLFFIVKLVKIK